MTMTDHALKDLVSRADAMTYTKKWPRTLIPKEESHERSTAD